jgi:hypothetical protein
MLYEPRSRRLILPNGTLPLQSATLILKERENMKQITFIVVFLVVISIVGAIIPRASSNPIKFDIDKRAEGNTVPPYDGVGKKDGRVEPPVDVSPPASRALIRNQVKTKGQTTPGK